MAIKIAIKHHNTAKVINNLTNAVYCYKTHISTSRNKIFDFVSASKNIFRFLFPQLNISLCLFPQVKIFLLAETKTKNMFTCGNKN